MWNASPAACTGTFYVLIDGLHFEPRCVDEFSERRATLALRQPANSSWELTVRHRRKSPWAQMVRAAGPWLPATIPAHA